MFWQAGDPWTTQRPGRDRALIADRCVHTKHTSVRSEWLQVTDPDGPSERPTDFTVIGPFMPHRVGSVWLLHLMWSKSSRCETLSRTQTFICPQKKDFSVWIRLTSFCLFLACSTFFIDDLDLKSSLDVSTDGRVGPALGFHAGGCCSEPCWIICYWSYGDVLLNRTTMFLYPSGVTVIKTCQCL